MAKYPNILLTNDGIDMIAESESGKALIFTSIKLGDGNIADGENQKTFTSMKNSMMKANISSIEVENGQTTISATVSNANVSTGFFARELGVFAKVGEDGIEKLYAYTNAGNYADYMPDSTSPIDENVIQITLVTATAENVTAVINSSIVYARLSDVEKKMEEHNENQNIHMKAFEKHNTSETAHEDIRTAISEATKKAGLPVGFEYTIPYTELQSGQLALLGGKYPKSTYTDLWAWVQTHSSLIKTETEWQAMKTASGGRAVPFYADVDDTHFRVPLVTTWVRGASSVDEVGGVLEAGLPNITGEAGEYAAASVISSGALKTALLKNGVAGTGTTQGIAKATFDASLSNPIYGKSTTVQPQSVLRLWVVQAFGTNSNTGNMDVAQVAQGVTDLTSRVSTIENRGWFTQDLSQNGWCKMPNGLILQWGIGVAGAQGSTQVLTYPIALSRVLHVEVSSVYPSVSGDYDGEWQICNITATSLSVYSQVYDAGCTNPSIPHFFVIGVV